MTEIIHYWEINNYWITIIFY